MRPEGKRDQREATSHPLAQMRGQAAGSLTHPSSFISASPSSWPRRRRLHWPCLGHGSISLSRRLVLCRQEEERSLPSFAHKCTYQGPSPWLQQELPHLLSMQKKVVSGLLLTRGTWTWTVEKSTHYQLCGTMKFCNVTRRNEIFVNEVAANAVLLSSGTIDQFTTSIEIHSEHPDGNPASRKDGYWPAYILKAGQSTQIKVVVDIKSHHDHPLIELQALRLDLNFVSYGPNGRFLERQHVVLPLQYPDEHQNGTWRNVNDGAVLPVKTHILCHMDDPLEVLRLYAMHHAKIGDTIVIGETPLAIMQGRFRHPCNVRPSIMAKLACKLFHSTSSLATACGMQTLLDIIGKLRAVLAIIVAVLGRLVGVRGLFYRVAGDQARLIDDVTGTLPPYDQFITLGPVCAQATADSLQEKTGIGVAIVDANNLGRVDVLAASDKVDRAFLNRVLKTNPAGNEDEQTPIVIVRPLKNS